MYFLVKVRIDTNNIMELGQKLQSGELDIRCIKSTYCIKDDPAVGVSIWETESKEQFDKVFAPMKPYYKEIMEITPVILPKESMALLMQSVQA